MLLDVDSTQPLTITTAPVPGAADRWRVTVTGELDLAAAPQLQRCLAEQLSAAHGVELEMTGVGFIDSSGIRVIVEGLRSFSAAGRLFALREPLPAQMRRVLEVSGLLARLPLSSGD